MKKTLASSLIFGLLLSGSQAFAAPGDASQTFHWSGMVPAANTSSTIKVESKTGTGFNGGSLVLGIAPAANAYEIVKADPMVFGVKVEDTGNPGTYIDAAGASIEVELGDLRYTQAGNAHDIDLTQNYIQLMLNGTAWDGSRQTGLTGDQTFEISQGSNYLPSSMFIADEAITLQATMYIKGTL